MSQTFTIIVNLSMYIRRYRVCNPKHYNETINYYSKMSIHIIILIYFYVM